MDWVSSLGLGKSVMGGYYVATSSCYFATLAYSLQIWQLLS